MDAERPTPGQWTRWSRRWLANPIASLALGAVLVGDALTLPRFGDPTVVGAIVESFTARRFICRLMGGPYSIYIAEDGARMRVIDSEEESWDELSRLLADGDTPVAHSHFVNRTSRQGVWSHVIERSYEGIVIEPLNGSWTADDIAAAHRALFDERTQTLPCWVYLQDYQHVPIGTTSSTRILWGGVAHDAFALATFAGLFYSCTGWRAWFAAHPWSRRNRRLLRGLCPECGYDTRGLATCPECGTASPERQLSEPRA